MKNSRWIILGILGCLGILLLSYFWATGMMDTLYTFRSPLANDPPAPDERLGQPHTRRAVLVLVDALRYDTSVNPDVMPFLNQLRAQGASAIMHSRTPSYSAPGYTVLLTGAWPGVSDGPAMNPEGKELPRTWTQDNLFAAAHRAGLKTAVSGYFWFQGLIPQDAVDASFYTEGEDAAADREVVDAALPWLSGDYQLILIHIDQVDYAGHHEGGPQSQNWNDAARRSDDLIREIASSLDLQLDTLIAFSDHGQIDRGGHGGQEPIVLVEPFVMAGAGIKPGRYGDIQMADVAPTIAVLLGTNIPASNQGHVLTEALDLSDESTIQNALAKQQERLYKAYISAIGARAVKISITPGQDVVDAYESAIESAEADRLNRERLPRFILAAVIALIPAWVLFRKRGRAVLWLLGGAVLYLVLFNLRYAVTEKRTYSLSSVSSADDIILFTAGTAVLCFFIAWCVTTFGLKLHRATPRQAAETSLAFIFTVLYLLALPILWSFGLNGPLITWALPEMASMFMAFLSTLQALVTAGAGLILTGVAALLALINQKR